MTALDRSLAVEFNREGNELEALMVPWMRPTDVTDIFGDRIVSYREQFARGAFQRAEAAPHRVMFYWTHQESFANALGRGVHFGESDAGMVGRFRLNDHDAPRARAVLDGMGVSLRFETIRPRMGLERSGALVTREAVHLIHLAAVPDPAYTEAKVLALRERDAEAAEAAEAAREADRALSIELQRAVDVGVTLPADRAAWLAQHPVTREAETAQIDADSSAQ